MERLIVIFYVDALAVLADTEENLDALQTRISSIFKMKTIVIPKNVLAIKFHWNANSNL